MCDKENAYHRDVSFEPNTWVWLRLQAYHQHFVNHQGSQKLSPHFFGPFLIHRRIRQVVYELELPPESRIHLVFHVSLLHSFKCHEALSRFITPPTDIGSLNGENSEVYPISTPRKYSSSENPMSSNTPLNSTTYLSILIQHLSRIHWTAIPTQVCISQRRTWFLISHVSITCLCQNNRNRLISY